MPEAERIPGPCANGDAIPAALSVSGVGWGGGGGSRLCNPKPSRKGRGVCVAGKGAGGRVEKYFPRCLWPLTPPRAVPTGVETALSLSLTSHVVEIGFRSPRAQNWSGLSWEVVSSLPGVRNN